MDVPDLHITWSHTYTSDDIVEVPGFTVSVPSVISAGVYVQVGLTPNNNELRLTVGTSNRIHDKKRVFCLSPCTLLRWRRSGLMASVLFSGSVLVRALAWAPCCVLWQNTLL